MCDVKTMNIGQVVAAYIRIRDQKAELKAKQAEALKPYDQALDQLESRALEILQTSTADSMKTPAGTAYVTERTSVSCADHEAFLDYVKDNGAFELLDLRPNKTAVKEYMAEHQDTPPGVNVRSVLAVNFNRA